MGNFKIEEQRIKGLYVVEPKVFGDERGYFMETYHQEDFQAAGIKESFVQHNQSMSKKKVLRGLHFQIKHPQGKLVRALKGEIFDVAVDLRGGSPTYGEWFGIVLSDENRKMLYVPPGFAHGYMVLSEEAVFSYLCTDFYHPEDEGGLMWNDPAIGITWPLEQGIEPILSEKDRKYPSFEDNKIIF